MAAVMASDLGTLLRLSFFSIMRESCIALKVVVVVGRE